MSKNPYPTRMCSGCRQRRSKKELIRIVSLDNGKATIDTDYKLEGRGVYVCPDIKCIILAQKKNSFAKGLKKPVDAEIYERLLKLAERE